MPRVGDRHSKSPRLKQLEGDRRKVGRTKLEQQVEREARGRGKPEIPAHLSPAQKKAFKHVLDTAPEVLLARADQALIENYAVAVVAAETARAKLEVGLMVQGVDGPVTNPFWRIWKQAQMEARMMGSELGMSPASRARLSVTPEKTADPMELLLGPSADDPNGAWAN